MEFEVCHLRRVFCRGAEHLAFDGFYVLGGGLDGPLYYNGVTDLSMIACDYVVLAELQSLSSDKLSNEFILYQGLVPSHCNLFAQFSIMIFLNRTNLSLHIKSSHYAPPHQNPVYVIVAQ